MLTEFLEQAGPGVDAAWSTVMPGVRACRFTVSPTDDRAVLELPATLAPMHFESLFCCRGSLTVTRSQSGPLTVSPQELFLLADAESLRSDRKSVV